MPFKNFERPIGNIKYHIPNKRFKDSPICLEPENIKTEPEKCTNLGSLNDEYFRNNYLTLKEREALDIKNIQY